MRQSYDDDRSYDKSYDWRDLQKKSYDKVMINLWHNLQQSYDHDFVVITLL